MTANLYHPESWVKNGHWDYINQTPQNSGQWKKITYLINDHSQLRANFIVVHDDLDIPLKAEAHGENFILVTGEEKSMKGYHQDFLAQFDLIITSRDDIKHKNVLRTHYFHPWSIKRKYDELILSNPTKTSNLSAVVSNATILPGHKQRFALLNKLKGHFKNELDWFCKGEDSFVEDKWDGLASYRYSISIENSRHPNYFTEKISDCFLAGAMPFYTGCPNIGDFFDDRSFVSIEKGNYLETISIIESCIKENYQATNAAYILESKQLILEKYHFIAAITEELNKLPKASSIVKRTLYPHFHFTEKKLIKKIISRVAQKILS